VSEITFYGIHEFPATMIDQNGNVPYLCDSAKNSCTVTDLNQQLGNGMMLGFRDFAALTN
jgi:hypothetical protein